MWRPQHYEQIGRQKGVGQDVLDGALEIGQRITSIHPGLPPIFTLRHLAHLANVPYGFLRSVVSRGIEDPYTVFRIRKRGNNVVSDSFRIICVPDPSLMKIQRWINKNILRFGRPHQACYSYIENTCIRDLATLHCNCRWLIKLDVRKFFESISEIRSFRVFLELGYQPLVAFELSRLCTRLGSYTAARKHVQWFADSNKYQAINQYQNRRIGHLPQGAPTSPMLSNLALKDFDEAVSQIAQHHDIMYTRYADDIHLSSVDVQFGRAQARRVIGKVYSAMARIGLSPNTLKTKISPPGGRKIVLGLLVDGDEPRLRKDFRARLRQHIYYLSHPHVGPAQHSARRGFASVWGLRNHVRGLISYARQIDQNFANQCEEQLKSVEWPL